MSSRIQKLEMHQKIHLGKLEKSFVCATFRQFQPPKIHGHFPMAQQFFKWRPSITRSLAIANWAVEVPGFWRSRRFQSGLAAMIFPSQVGEGLIFGLFLGEGFILSYFFFGDLLESMRAKDILSDTGRTLVSRISSDHQSVWSNQQVSSSYTRSSSWEI